MGERYILKDINLFQLINIIFTNPIKQPNSIIIDINKIASDQNLTIFQTLMSILINGAQILYGENITAENITEKQYNTLKDYIKSIGFELHHEYKYDENEIPIMVNLYFLPFVGSDLCNGYTIS
jgi:hypothetical protein